jgi:hypothetical protein
MPEGFRNGGHMTGLNGNSPPTSLQRIGMWVWALASAVAVTFVISGFNPILRSSGVARFIIFVASYAGCYLVWNWVFFVRPAELKKKLPITGEELRRKRKEFYDSLP